MGWWRRCFQMMFEDLWGPLSSMLRVLHTGGANQEHFDLHHQRCKSRCNLHLDLHQQRCKSRCNLNLYLQIWCKRFWMLQSRIWGGCIGGFWGGKTHPFEGVGCHRFEVVGKHRVEGVDFGSPNCPESIFTSGQFFGSFDALGFPTNEEKKSGDKIREKFQRLKNKNPRKIRSAKIRP